MMENYGDTRFVSFQDNQIFMPRWKLSLRDAPGFS